MMKKLITITLILFFLVSNHIRANNNYDECKKDPPIKFINKIKEGNKSDGESRYIYDFSQIDFGKYKKINRGNVLTLYNELFGIDDTQKSNYQLVLAKKTKSNREVLNKVDIEYYNINYGDYRIEGREFIMVLKGDEIKEIRSRFFHDIESIPNRTQTIKEINDKILLHLEAKGYTVFVPELGYTPEKIYMLKDRIFAFKANVQTYNPSDTKYVYIDAVNGGLIKEYSNRNKLVKFKELEDDCVCSTSFSTQTISVQTTLEGNQTITIDKCQDDNSGTPNFHKLYDENIFFGEESIYSISSLDAFVNGTPPSDYTEPIEWCNEDLNNMTDFMIKESDSYFSTEVVYNYMDDFYGIGGIDGNHTPLKLITHDPGAGFFPGDPINTYSPTNSASYGDFDLVIGDGVPEECSTMGTIEVVGHEMMHGYLNEYFFLETKNADINNLTYWSTKALHEAICDMVGLTINYWNDDSAIDVDWSFGNNTCSNHSSLPRTFDDPRNSKVPQAIYYEDEGIGFWSSEPQDYYIRAGVISHWYYLLSEGGTGIYGTTVGGQTIVTAEFLLFETLKLMKSDLEMLDAGERILTFEQFRDYSIQATIDIYGECSVAHTSVARAWRAVGLMDCDDLDAITIGIDETPGDDCTTLLTADVQGGSGCYEYTWYEENGGGFIPISNQAPFYNQLEAECGMTYKLKISDVIFPECGDVEQIYSTTSILNPNILKGTSLKVTPNPIIDGNAIVSIETNDYLDDASVMVFDITGKVIDELLSNSTITNNHRLELDVTDLPSGVYFVHLSTPEGVLTRKFIKQ